MMFIPATGKVKYTHAKAYCSISLLSFMQKRCKFRHQECQGWNMGYVPYIYKNFPTNQGSPHKPQCTMWSHIYRKQWKTGSDTWAFLHIEEATDSTSCDITKAAKWYGLGDTLWWLIGSLLGGRNTYRRNTGGVCGQGLSTEDHFTP